MRRKWATTIILTLLLFINASPALALTNFSSYWSQFSGGQLVLYWQGAEFITGGDVDPAVIVEYMRPKDKTWVTFDRYDFNVPNRSIEINKDDPRLVPGAIYYFRAGQRGIDNPLMMSSSGPVTIPGAPVDPDDLAHLNDPVDNPPTGGNQLPPGQDSQNGDEDTSRHKPLTDIPLLFTQQSWEKTMFWYQALAALSGIFILGAVIKCGYKYFFSAFNPGVRASLTETLQRCVIAVAIIMLAPVFIKVLVAVNDSFVYFFASAGQEMIDPTISGNSQQLSSTGLFEMVISAPFKVLVDILYKVFGLYDIPALIFNGNLTILTGSLSAMPIDTGNVFGDVIIEIVLVGFTFYYNALYTVRRWVIVATFAATPLLIWIWVWSEEKQVIEIWAGELISTIFMQTFHALTFALLFSIASQKGIAGVANIPWLAENLRGLLFWVAGFGGVIAVCGLIYLAYRLVMATTEKARTEVKEGFGKVVIGLVVLGLCLTIASFVVHTLGGEWGVNDLTFESRQSGLRLWDIFFMLLVIIPTSKMMHSIFMRLIQRIGTVDEERWAAIGSGALGTITGMMAVGSIASGAVARKLGVGGTSTGARIPLRNQGPNTVPPGSGAIAGISSLSTGTSSGGDIPGGVALKGGLGPVPGTIQYDRRKHDLADMRTISMNDVNPQVNEHAQKIAETYPVGEGSGFRTLGDVVDSTSDSKWMQGGAIIGAMTSIATPSVMPVMTGIGAIAGKTIGAPIVTATSLVKTVKQNSILQGNLTDKGWREAIKLSGGYRKVLSDFGSVAQQMTGSRSTTAAVGRMVGSVLVSPLGDTARKHVGMSKDLRQTMDAMPKWRR